MKDDAGWEDYIKEYSKKIWPEPTEIEKEFTKSLIKWDPLTVYKKAIHKKDDLLSFL